jgi:rhodanese-related sulfurtransferase
MKLIRNLKAGLWRATCLLALSVVACSQPAAEMSDREKVQKIETLYQEYRKSFPEVPSVDVQQLEKLRRGGPEVVVVDVRQPEEWQVSMIPGAISQAEFEASALEPGDAIVVTYCTVGYRSGLYAKDLLQEGWEAFNLEGSILAWTHAGLPLASDTGTTKRVHVYSRTWNLAATGYEAVW